MDMGVDDYLLASTLTGVLAQRLVRRLCAQCSAPADAAPQLLERLNARNLDFRGLRRKVGCPACRNTGYQGRTTISELLVMTDTLRQRVVERSSDSGIEAAAIESGMISLLSDGLSKAVRGETTIDEVMRVTRVG
jgi:general secretion pathway protein E